MYYIGSSYLEIRCPKVTKNLVLHGGSDIEGLLF